MYTGIKKIKIKRFSLLTLILPIQSPYTDPTLPIYPYGI